MSRSDSVPAPMVLPRTPGSVVEATHRDQRGLWMLTPLRDWVMSDINNTAVLAATEGLTVHRVLFDAATPAASVPIDPEQTMADLLPICDAYTRGEELTSQQIDVFHTLANMTTVRWLIRTVYGMTSHRDSLQRQLAASVPAADILALAEKWQAKAESLRTYTAEHDDTYAWQYASGYSDAAGDLRDLVAAAEQADKGEAEYDAHLGTTIAPAAPPEPLCRCGHGPKNHAARQWDCYICGSDECADYTPQNRYFVPKARVPVNDEAPPVCVCIETKATGAIDSTYCPIHPVNDEAETALARVRGLTVQYETCRGNLERASQRLSNIRAAVDVLRNAVEGPDTSDPSMTVADDRDVLLSAARHLIATVGKRDDDVAVSPTDHPMAALIEAVKEPPQVVPTNDGNVQLEWHRCGIDIEIGVVSRGTLDGWWDRAARGEDA